MIILNYIIGTLALIVGVISILRISGVMKSSGKLDVMREKLGDKTGAILYTITYGILPIAISIFIIFLTINGISFI
jgi:hypothetical protein